MAVNRKLKKQLNNLIDRFTPEIKSAFIASIADVTDSASINAIIEAIQTGDVLRAFRATGMSDAAMRPLTRMVESAFETGGITVTRTFPMQMTDAGASILHFDVRNSRAERYLREHSSQLVTRITAETQQNIQTIVEAGMRQGRNPRNIALDIVGRVDDKGVRSGGIIGLTGPQTKWVSNAREELTGVPPDEAYFARVQRDKRFDSTVRKAINEGRGLKPEEVDTLTKRYSDNLLQLRGETIARTEAMTALAKSQDEAIRQAIDAGTLNARHVTKVWDATGDARTRPSHMHMDGQRVGMDEAFKTDNGAQLMFPLDTSLGAPGSETINCRCRVDYDMDWLADVIDDPDINWDEWDNPTPPPAPPAPPAPVETPAARNTRLDVEQRSAILERGRAENIEYLSAIDQVTGEVFGQNSGTKGNVKFTPEFERAISDPARNIVAHHNHPSSSSFSTQDFVSLTEFPGLKGLWAHGHNGTSYFAESARKKIGQKEVNSAVQDLKRSLDAEVRSGGATPDQINSLGMNHFISTYLKARGWLKTYRVENSETITAGQPLVDRVLKRLGL